MNKRVSLFGFIVLACFFVYSRADGAEWVLLRKTNVGNAYYDRQGIEQVSEKVLRVGVKYVYSSEGIDEFRKAFPDIPAAESISYTLYTYELVCSSSSFKLLNATTYDSGGAPINGTELKEETPAPEHVTPNSMMEDLFYSACNWAHYEK